MIYWREDDRADEHLFKNRHFQQLRKMFDGDDSFMTAGHQRTNLRTRERTVPDWTRSNKEVRKVLLRSFPKLLADPQQRLQAARWARVIHLYFRMHYTYKQVSAELDKTPKSIESIIRSIKRVADGRRANGNGLRSLRGPGRPKSTKNPCQTM
jgi:hypothetical protein